MARVQALGPCFAAFPSSLKGSRVGGGTVGTPASCEMPASLITLNPLYHNTDPRFSTLSVLFHRMKKMKELTGFFHCLVKICILSYHIIWVTKATIAETDFILR